MPENKRNHIIDTKAGHLVTIAAASQLLNVSSKTIRRWESYGLITPLRNQFNHRVYSIDQLRSIQHKKYQPLPPTRTPKTIFYTVSEAAIKLGISIKTLRRWEQAGKIVCQRNERNQRIFSKSDIETLIDEQRTIGQKPAFIHRASYWYNALAVVSFFTASSLLSLLPYLFKDSHEHPLALNINSLTSLSNQPISIDIPTPTPNHLALAILPYTNEPLSHYKSNIILQNEFETYAPPPHLLPAPPTININPTNFPNTLPLTNTNNNINKLNMLNNFPNEAALYNVGAE